MPGKVGTGFPSGIATRKIVAACDSLFLK